MRSALLHLSIIGGALLLFFGGGPQILYLVERILKVRTKTFVLRVENVILRMRLQGAQTTLKRLRLLAEGLERDANSRQRLAAAKHAVDSIDLINEWHLSSPNENKISDSYRERVPIEVEVF